MISQKIRIYPTKKQALLLDEYFGYSRWCYNAALEEWQVLYVAGQKPNERKVRDVLKTKLPEWSAGFPKSIVDTSCEHLGRAYKNFFESRAHRPKFKSRKASKQSFELYRKNDSSIRIVNGFWKLQKEKIKMSEPLRFTSTIKRLTCSCQLGKYYISLTFEEDFKKPDDNGFTVGLDWGIDHYFISNEGENFDLRDVSDFYQKIRFLQRCLSKKDKNSKRYAKARAKLTRVYEHLDNIKKDSQSKMVHELVTRFSHIATEDLSFRALVYKNRGKKAKIRKMLRYSNSEIVAALKSKAFDYRQINRYFPSSQVCSSCGKRHSEMKNEKIRTLVCDCGLIINRDVNAAINIKTVAFDK